MLNKKNLYISRDNSEEIVLKARKKINIVLLREEIFIKIIKVDKKDNIEKLITENIDSTFRYYEVLTHYQKVSFNNNNYLVIYFIKYYNALRKIISKKKVVSLRPYEFTEEFKNKDRSKGLNISIKTFKGYAYIVGKINKTIVYTKSFDIDENIKDYVLECLEYLKEIFSINDFILFIEENLYNNELNKLTKNIKLIKGKVS